MYFFKDNKNTGPPLSVTVIMLKFKEIDITLGTCLYFKNCRQVGQKCTAPRKAQSNMDVSMLE